MQSHYIRRGYDIPIRGRAKAVLKEAPRSSYSTIRPVEFHYVKPKLEIAVGDAVRIGTPLFHDKRQPEVVFVSPACGKIHDIHFGPRRIIERIVIEDSGEDAVQWPSFRPGDIHTAGRNKIKELLLKGGLWPFIRQRPFDIIADPHKQADAVFINCMDTAPLAADPEFALKDHLADFKAGVAGLQVLCKAVHLVVSGKAKPSIFQGLEKEKISLHSFVGRHPAGLVGTHIHSVSPLHPGKTIWYLNARDVVCIGNFLLVGQYPTARVVALAGMGLKERSYFKIRAGASLGPLLKHNLVSGGQRIISGNVLTGKKINSSDSLGFYDDLVTVILQGKERHFLGWMLPGLSRPSWSYTFVSSFLPKRQYAMSANKNGEVRALVKTGDYEKVVALNILPYFLIKAILTEDIESMEQLGIHEVAPEDLALCSYICPSKVEFTEILRSGLDMMLAETS